MSKPRYFIDERTGCIAVRDKEKTDPEYPGLHPDTEGVVLFWCGKWAEGELCPHCHQRMPGHWEILEKDKAEAQRMCELLNNGEIKV